MYQGAKLDAEDAAALLQLANGIHRLPSHPVGRKQHFLNGLVKLINAASAMSVVTFRNNGDAPIPISVTRSARAHKTPGSGTTGARSRSLDRHELEKNPLVQQVYITMRAGNHTVESRDGDGRAMLCSVVPLDRPKAIAGLVLAKRAGDMNPFSSREQVLVSLFHREMRWIYEFDLPLMSPEVLNLSTRPQETLQYLLAGCSEKETAHELKVSHNTVHHYVKQLYRHFGVSSRSELLARWVRK